MRKRTLILVTIWCLTRILFSQQQQADSTRLIDTPGQALSSDLKTRVEELAKLQKHFGKDMNSPGVELSLKEINRSRSTDRTLVTYSLFATGFPQKAIFTLYQVDLDGSVVKILEHVTLDNQGQAICGGRGPICRENGPGDAVDLVVYGAKGEPKRFALASEGEHVFKGFIAVIPFPNDVADKSCKLQSVLGTSKGELMFIQGTGFESNSNLTITTQSYEEKHQYNTRADANGFYFATLMPYVAGKKSGETRFEVKSRSCDPEIKFEWGENSSHPE